MKLIIDTSILIDHLRGGDQWEKLITSLDPDTELYLPTVVMFELFSGKSTVSPSVAKEINTLLKFFQKIDLTEKIARRAGELFRDVNNNLGAPDYIMAASALELSGSLVTLNTKHFKTIPNLSIYPL